MVNFQAPAALHLGKIPDILSTSNWVVPWTGQDTVLKWKNIMWDLKDVEVRFLLWNGIFNVIYRRNQKFCDC